MTCVTGHLTGLEFTPEFKNWSYPPPESLFQAPVITTVPDVRIPKHISLCRIWLTTIQDKKTIAKNLADQAKFATLLIIWTDCDREGEHIGHEIVEAAKKGNPRIQVKRAKFSNVERA